MTHDREQRKHALGVAMNCLGGMGDEVDVLSEIEAELISQENTYTVFAVYEDNLQPYSTTVQAGSPEIAVRLAQIQCLEDNGAELADIDPPDYGSCTLVGYQVVEGRVEAVLWDEMPFEVGQKVIWERSQRNPWTIRQIITEGQTLAARIVDFQGLHATALTSELTPTQQP